MNLFIILLQTSLFMMQDATALEDYVIGNWEWTKTQRNSRAASKTVDPKSCDCTKMIKFTSNGKLEIYEDQVLISTSDYKINPYQIGESPVQYKLVSADLNGFIAKQKNSGLIIGAFGSCGDMHYYKKSNK